MAEICVKCCTCQNYGDCRKSDAFVYCIFSGNSCVDAHLFDDCYFSCKDYKASKRKPTQSTPSTAEGHRPTQ